MLKFIPKQREVLVGVLGRGHYPGVLVIVIEPSGEAHQMPMEQLLDQADAETAELIKKFQPCLDAPVASVEEGFSFKPDKEGGFDIVPKKPKSPAPVMKLVPKPKRKK